MVDWMRNQLKEHGVEGLVEAVQFQGGDPLNNALKDQDPQAQHKLLNDWLDELDGMYLRLADNLALPFSQFKEADEVLTRDIQKSDNLLVKQILPALGNAREREQYVFIGRQILMAMMAYRLQGKDAFDQVVDPTDGKPFEMKKDEENNVLWVQSRCINQYGIPVRISFDQGMAEPLK